ncbi:septicolysin [Betaproteobacteria bacterium GR16-43]|nr:septicolysin [Betaproteobacteria bacterium GR16-43]
MKLAEALLLRGDVQKKLASLRDRVGRNALMQEGNSPNEDPNALMNEAVGVIGELEALVVRINAANLVNKIPDGRTLTAAIARRDALTDHHSLLQAAISATQKEPDRYSAREIKWIPVVDVKKLQRQSEDLAKTIRELNAAIQETNWKVEL